MGDHPTGSVASGGFTFVYRAGGLCHVRLLSHKSWNRNARHRDNNEMIRALGVNDENMIILGLAISNGLIALAGAFIAQYQGFADVQMGIGMVVWGLASGIIGEALVGTRQLGL